MADVVLNIKGDSSDAVQAISQVGNEFDKVNQANKKNVEEHKKGAKQIVDANENVVKSQKEMTNAITDTLKNLIALNTLKNIAADVIKTTAEFQKFEAVLTNTLGSKSEAQKALNRIQDFAAKTPFSVKEITEEFIKFANRGVIVSNEQLTKLGDTASALGKPLNSVTEAILDVSNTERWNELGIKVKVNGDKMSGTFKGLTVDVDKTEMGALKMIETFGEMEGVVGGMAAISDTLGGKISNLGDQYDSFLNTVGTKTGPAIEAGISGLSTLLAGLEGFLGGLGDLISGNLASANNISELQRIGNVTETTAKQIEAAGFRINNIYDEQEQAATNRLSKLIDLGEGLAFTIEKTENVTKKEKAYTDALKISSSQLSDIQNKYKTGQITQEEYSASINILTTRQKQLGDALVKVNKEKDKGQQIDKKAAEEARKKAADDEKKLKKIIEDNAVEAIQNDQEREEAKAKLEFERKKKEIEASKASQKTKNEALLSIDLEYANKRTEIENKYNDAKEKRDKEAADKQNQILVDAANKNAEVLQGFIKYELDALDGKFGEAEKIIAKQQIETKIALGTATPEETDAYNNLISKQKEENDKKQLEAYKKFVDVFGGELKDFLNEQFDAQQSLLDAEQDANDEVKKAREDKLKSLQDQLAAEYELQRHGLANNVDAILAAIAAEEQAKQQDLENDKRIKEEKAKLAKAQLLVDSATQASSLFTASAEIYKSLAALGPIGVAGAIATIALMIGSFVSAKAKALEAINAGAGFQKGGHTGNMGETEIAGVVHGQEFVSTAKTTRKHRNLLEAMHSEDYSGLTIKDLAPLLSGTGVTFNKDVLNEIRNDQANYTAKKEAEPMMLISVMSATNKKVDKFFQYVKNKPQNETDENGNKIIKKGNTIKIIRKK